MGDKTISSSGKEEKLARMPPPISTGAERVEATVEAEPEVIVQETHDGGVQAPGEDLGPLPDERCSAGWSDVGAWCR